jgi:phospholipid-binding lipoprotein MlaA
MRALPMILMLCLIGMNGRALAQEAISDPQEGFNRDMFAVNESLDHHVLEPVAKGYRAATPRFFRAGVRNFLNNLRGPVIFVNDVLQGEASRAGVTAGRFVINTTVGVVGVFDIAQKAGLERHDEDFGQTLAVWGVAPGRYVYLPVVGPTTVRDGLGRVADIAFSPLTWAKFDGDTEFAATRVVVGGVSDREGAIEVIDGLRQTSFDPYTSVRSTYALSRESAIRNRLQDVQDLPDFQEIPSEAQPEPTPDVGPVKDDHTGEPGITQ